MSEEINEFKINKFTPSKSIYIEASAGTGKTYTIQLIVARMVAEGTPLKKILIVTYTEKAAGELKDRIRKKIDEVLQKGRIDKSEPELSPEQMSNFRKAYQDVDNAAIFTIHSFCQKALKEYAYDAGRPFDMAMVDDSAVEDMVDQYIRDKWNKDDEFIALLREAESTSSLIGNLKSYFIKAVDMYKGVDASGKEIVTIDEVEMPKLGEKALSLEELEKIAQAKNFEELVSTLHLEGHLEIFEANTDKFFTKKNTGPIPEFLSSLKKWKKGSPLYDGSFKDGKCPQEDWPKDMYASFCYLKELKGFLSDIDKKVEKVKLHKFLIAHTPQLFDAWQAYKAENKLQSFNDMILSVHKAVMEPGSALKERLSAQYTYAIIDEFQDTNQLQWDIFSNVFLNFVVGDPKQSIYSFQGADVNVYKKATGEIGKKIDLVHNFRSTDGIINGCNALFSGNYFAPAEGMPELVKFKDSYPPDGENADQKKKAPEIDGNEVRSIWLSEKDISADSFAATAVAHIIDWCSFREDGKTTRLQVFDKDYGKPGHDSVLKNVTFKDFAILAKSRSEMENIESIMRSVGVPYTQYKETNLFRSRECAEWISLFRAINAPDFSSWNRQLLSEVLITDFFKDVVAERERATRGSEQSSGLEELHYAESKEFDDPNNPERLQIASWRTLALKRRYAEMLERIYDDTQIEYRLMDVSRLQSMARLRQIGNYAIDYLYNHRCSLDDLIRHLQGLARYEESADDENGDLVEKGSDFNAVQVMTIHASKGLEFPVVISVAGFKQLPNSKPPYITHGKDESLHLGFGDTAKECRQREEMEEWKRLFYVDFTRASSLLLIPRYDVWYNKPNKNEPATKSGYFKHVHFLMDALENFAEKSTNLYDRLLKSDQWVTAQEGIAEKANLVKDILARTNVANSNTVDLDKAITEQKVEIASLQGKVASASIMQYSYSSLSGRAETPIAEADDSRTEKEGESTAEEIPVPGMENYPRGSKVGDALHNILERMRFMAFGESFKSLEDALGHTPNIETSELENVIEEEFKAQSLPIAAHKKEWTEITTRLVWNTLHASLPVIEGAEIHRDATFRLVELPLNDHKPEVQFGMNAYAGNPEDSGTDAPPAETEAFAILHRVCKGFIDLLFVREVNKQKRYSILDWKSDSLENYGDAEIKKKVDEDYSVQRVLYSYCLIQWLKQFYGKRADGSGKGLDEQQIFEQYFGGIYYAFLRGTDGATSKGIYAHTWKDYASLEEAYGELKKLMSKKKKDEGEN